MMASVVKKKSYCNSCTFRNQMKCSHPDFWRPWMEAQKATINDLPNELLVVIFEKIEYDLQSLMRVCKRWRAIVNEKVGTSEYVGDGNKSGFWDFGLPWIPLRRIKEQGISACWISSSMDHNDKLRHDAFPSFRYPYLVREIGLDGFFPSDQFLKLLLPLKNVVILELHVTTVSHLSETLNIDFFKDMNIRQFAITNAGFKLRDLLKCDMIRFCGNFRRFMALRFAGLKTVEIGIPYIYDYEAEISQEIILFLLGQKKTLTEATLNFRFCHWINEPEDSITRSVHTQRVYDSMLDFTEDHKKEISRWRDTLVELKYETDFLHPSCCANLWRKLYTPQTKLVKLDFKTGKYWRLPVYTISANHKTLTSVYLTVKASRFSPMDLRVFSRCANLRSLGLEGSKKLSFQRPNGHSPGTWTEIINGHCLPKLHHLLVWNLWVSSDQANGWAFSQTELHEFDLANIGCSHGLGLTLTGLLAIYRRRLENSLKISIYEALNMSRDNSIEEILNPDSDTGGSDSDEDVEQHF